MAYQPSGRWPQCLASDTNQRFVSLVTHLRRVSHYAHHVDRKTINSNQGFGPLEDNRKPQDLTPVSQVRVSHIFA